MPPLPKPFPPKKHVTQWPHLRGIQWCPRASNPKSEFGWLIYLYRWCILRTERKAAVCLCCVRDHSLVFLIQDSSCERTQTDLLGEGEHDETWGYIEGFWKNIIRSEKQLLQYFGYVDAPLWCVLKGSTAQPLLCSNAGLTFNLRYN